MVQIMPFVFGIVYLVSFVVYLTGSDYFSQICDSLFYVSPMSVAGLLSLSYPLKLCKWHRRACCVPLIPMAVAIVDYYVIELSEVMVFVHLCICVISVAVLLISAYKIFLS